ncbi:Pentatricopeptide repeat-containing protein [Forsythia ovata]|uniref:Pentatricopeptide repeat-containing protein n=1 Tax=Forsythia ovata TaxID=205694 RepID=A0ABD1S2Q7_9LAMI
MQSNRSTFQALIRTYISGSRCYYTKSKKKNEASLYAKISPLGNPNVNVTPELENWVQLGNKVRFAELQRIIIDLRKRKRYSQALQVSEWMKGKDVYAFTPVQHAVQLDLIGKVHGFLSAESYFNNLSEQDKTEKTYGALLHCYVRQRQTEKASAHLQKMKEKNLALSSVAFNDIMSLYSSIGENEKVTNVLNKMKESGIPPDNLSYRICINSYGVRSDIEGVEKMLNEMESQAHLIIDWNTYAVVANFYIKAGLIYKANVVLKKAEERLDSKDGLGYNHLISLHARLGNRDEVLRLWDLEKDVCKRCLNRDYINMIESLMKLDELEEVEKLLKEWEASGNCYDFRVPNAAIVGYTEKGLCEKAEAMLEYLMENGKVSTANSWGKVAVGYLEKGEVENALRSMKVALSLHVGSKEWKLDPKVITRILSLVGEKGCNEDSEKTINWLRSVMPLNRQMYHALLKSYISVGKEVDRLLNSMRADNLDEDEETKKILSMKQNET